MEMTTEAQTNPKPILILDPAEVSQEFALQEFIQKAEKAGYLVLLGNNETEVAQVLSPQGDPWKPIETVPRIDAKVLLLWEPLYGVQAACWDKQEGAWIGFDSEAIEEPIAWRPLPFGPLRPLKIIPDEEG